MGLEASDEASSIPNLVLGLPLTCLVKIRRRSCHSCGHDIQVNNLLERVDDAYISRCYTPAPRICPLTDTATCQTPSSLFSSTNFAFIFQAV